MSSVNQPSSFATKSPGIVVGPRKSAIELEAIWSMPLWPIANATGRPGPSGMTTTADGSSGTAIQRAFASSQASMA